MEGKQASATANKCGERRCGEGGEGQGGVQLGNTCAAVAAAISAAALPAASLRALAAVVRRMIHFSRGSTQELEALFTCVFRLLGANGGEENSVCVGVRQRRL